MSIINPSVHTYSGKVVSLRDIHPDEIEREDIAHTLSLLCRYGGHCSEFYSVAEHSCIAADCFKDPVLSLYALLHDAAEAYIVDIPTPIKRFFPEVVALEDVVLEKVFAKFGLDPHLPSEVKQVDVGLRIPECRALMKFDAIKDWGMDPSLEPKGVVIECWTPKVAKARFLDKLAELEKRVNGVAADIISQV